MFLCRRVRKIVQIMTQLSRVQTCARTFAQPCKIETNMAGKCLCSKTSEKSTETMYQECVHTSISGPVAMYKHNGMQTWPIFACKKQWKTHRYNVPRVRPHFHQRSDGNVQTEQKVRLPIKKADTVVNPYAMMVEIHDTAFASTHKKQKRPTLAFSENVDHCLTDVITSYTDSSTTNFPRFPFTRNFGPVRVKSEISLSVPEKLLRKTPGNATFLLDWTCTELSTRGSIVRVSCVYEIWRR